MNDKWPNLFLIGAAKAGTTSLYKYLNQHPQIFMSPIKEPHYFSMLSPSKNHAPIKNWVTKQDEYLGLFREGDGSLLRGEASTSYLYSKGTANRIARQIPEAKIIVLLRDPIDRAYSHYLMDVRAERQTLPFYEALIEDFSKTDKGWHKSNLYIELGLYCQQLRPYIDVFGRDRVLVLMFEDLKNNASQLFESVAIFFNIDVKSFMGIQAGYAHNSYWIPSQHFKYVTRSTIWPILRELVPSSSKRFFRNKLFTKTKNKPPVSVQAKQLMQEIYIPEIYALEEMLERELPELRKTWN